MVKQGYNYSRGANYLSFKSDETESNELSHHVRIVPVSRTSVGDDGVLMIPVIVDGPLNAVPRVLDVVKVPPEAAGVDDRGVVGRHTGVGLVDGPRAGVDHRPT